MEGWMGKKIRIEMPFLPSLSHLRKRHTVELWIASIIRSRNVLVINTRISK
jgi:hypothetical protein